MGWPLRASSSSLVRSTGNPCQGPEGRAILRAARHARSGLLVLAVRTRDRDLLMLGHSHPYRRQIEHLAPLADALRLPSQVRPTLPTRLWSMRDPLDSVQPMSRMAPIRSAALLPFRSAPQPIAGGRLVAILAVLAHPPFHLREPGFQLPDPPLELRHPRLAGRMLRSSVGILRF